MNGISDVLKQIFELKYFHMLNLIKSSKNCPIALGAWLPAAFGLLTWTP